jgi:hypothetical protein
MTDTISLTQGEPVSITSLQIEPILIEIEDPALEITGVVSTPVTITLGAIPGPIGPKGDDGLSAYQTAVANGFVGTEVEWLDSLTDHVHEIEDVNGLQEALDAKSDSDHTHDYTGDFAPLSHNHDSRYYTQTQIDVLFGDFSTSLAGIYSPIAHTHDYSGVFAALGHTHDYTAVFSPIAHTHDYSGVFAPLAHDHDTRYYTDAEVDALLTALAGTIPTNRAPDLLVPGTISTSTYNTQTTDRYTAYLVTYAGDCAITLDSDAPIGARIRFKQMHASGFHFVAGAGMTLNSRDAVITSAGLYAVSEAWRISTTEWSILGDVA